MELNQDGTSKATQLTRMYDHTGMHKYHVFGDDELLSDYSIKTLNRLVHGPNIDASDWSVYVANIREGRTTTMGHHCSMDDDHAKTAACFSDNLHQNYCPCWEYKDGVGWVRCGIIQKVMSVGCSKHRDDESRKVFDKLRKGYAVKGRELNNPNLGPAEENVKEEQSKDELVKKAEEAIEKQIQNGGDLDENMYIHSQLKALAAKKYGGYVHKRKDTKEATRGERAAAWTRDRTTTSDAREGGARYIARPMQELSQRGKTMMSIPELDEKAKNKVKGKRGSKMWNGWKEGPWEPENNGQFERATTVVETHRRTKEKTKGGS